MSIETEFYFEEHLVKPQERLEVFEQLCVDQGLDPAKIVDLWEHGELDPDARYDPTSEFHGKDIASLVMLLEEPLREPARRD
jgi:hypothetical protein